MLTNSDSDVKCKACQTLKPGAKEDQIKEERKEEVKEEVSKSSFTFGLSSAGSNEKLDIKLSSSFKFGAASDTTGFSFGLQKKEEEKTGSVEKPAFSFGAATSTATFSFGQAEKKAEEGKPKFSFGGPAKEEVKPGIGSLTSDTAPKSTPSFNFGVSATGNSTSATTEPVKFGATTAPPENVETKTAPSFNFGAATSATSTGLNFGGTTTTASALSFGGTSSTTTAAPSFNFGSTQPATVCIFCYI